ncbi:hypothetical protein C2857_002545 [Epichloe festucae Fl1]|uniref:Uncharacterized protein n=1 Tax=Epichloe festucae (strain Fl1) TaxID=877507 RepID=A0A7U3Q062_EPIFF|nr:hypothetical protein C2857_002545 [Epichloe festucae Fl1]
MYFALPRPPITPLWVRHGRRETVCLSHFSNSSIPPNSGPICYLVRRCNESAREIRNILPSQRFSLDLTDPEKVHQDKLDDLAAKIAQKQKQLDALPYQPLADMEMTEKRMQQLGQQLGQLNFEQASLRMSFVKNGDQARRAYLGHLEGDYQKMLQGFLQIQNIAKRLLPEEIEDTHAEGSSEGVNHAQSLGRVTGQSISQTTTLLKEDPESRHDEGRRRALPAARLGSKMDEKSTGYPENPGWNVSFRNVTPRASPFCSGARSARQRARRIRDAAITKPEVGRVYLGYWAPDSRNYAVIILPFGLFHSIGLPGSIASTPLLKCERRPSHTRHPDTGDYAWSFDFGDGGIHELDREFPVIWFGNSRFPEKAQYSWIKARHLTKLDMDKISMSQRNTVQDFLRRRDAADSMDNMDDRNASASVPAVRHAWEEESPQIDAYFDNVDYVDDDDPDYDPDIEMGDELPVKGRW